jgi:hypothetical protein
LGGARGQLDPWLRLTLLSLVLIVLVVVVLVTSRLLVPHVL